MPRASKHTTTTTANTQHRSRPYPLATSTTLAPSAMPSHRTSPHTSAAVADRHASQSWPPENDELLMRARQQGLNWQPIASQYFPDKTANACRKRHERLMEKRNSADNWDGAKMEMLSKAYVELREQMWKVLADRVGEKWQNVEAKVCHLTCGWNSCTVADKSCSAWREASRPSKQQVAQPHGETALDRIKTKRTASMTAPLDLKTTHSSMAMSSDQAETTSKPLTLPVAGPILPLRSAPTEHSASTATLPLRWQDSRPQRQPHLNFLLITNNRRHFRASVLPLACRVSQLFYITRPIIRQLLRLTSPITKR